MRRQHCDWRRKFVEPNDLMIEPVSRALSEVERRCTLALPSSRYVVTLSRAALLQIGAAQ